MNCLNVTEMLLNKKGASFKCYKNMTNIIGKILKCHKNQVKSFKARKKSTLQPIRNIQVLARVPVTSLPLRKLERGKSPAHAKEIYFKQGARS